MDPVQSTKLFNHLIFQEVSILVILIYFVVIAFRFDLVSQHDPNGEGKNSGGANDSLSYG